ncbi:MAG: LPS-assembly protein LptD [Nitrosomonadales bacterium]|nr:LPS-assembly protein LptD [Nitrosomonadales bacterium]
MRFRHKLVAGFLLCALAPTIYAEDEQLTLKLERVLSSAQHGGEETPIFISAQQVEGKKDSQVEARGYVEMRKRGQIISADHMLYAQDNREVAADGTVRVEQDNNVIRSPHLQLNLMTNIGQMSQPVFQFGDNHARGNAVTLNLEGRQLYILHDVNYTTCPADQDDWLLKVRELEIDRNSQLGVAHSARVEFMGVPILYTPWMSFGLNGQRKSGFLGPVFGSTVKGGSDLTLPYYWNIAPNMDATISPRIMSKRGILLNNELRYLEPAYSGEAHLDVLSGDRLTNSTRSRLALSHMQSFGRGLNGALNFNRVSDDAYFRDLSDAVSGTSQTNLAREGVLSYANGWWRASMRVQSFQTLQDPVTPVTVPYRRLPQINLAAQRILSRANISLAAEFVDFRHPTSVNGRRLVLYPSVSYPLVAEPAFYLTPKFGLHDTHYVLGGNNTGSLSNASRTLPIFSLDAGEMLERDWSVAGKSFIQTLEPRMFYVYIPYRDQSKLPNFDSAQADFSFAQIFTENRFFGSDRIGDANQMTLALTSRLLEPNSGAERLRVMVGQRFSTITPQVNLAAPATTTVSTTNKSDILLGLSGQVTSKWSADGVFQYNPNQARSEKFNAALRYQPESGKVLNLGYRFTHDSIRQVDMSAQWPLTGHWHGVVRWNYSLQDKQILEALTGLEYNQSCWTVRLVAQRFATATQQVSTGVFAQLELNDLVAVGADPLTLLRQNVPGYSKLNGSSHDGSEQSLQ